MKYTPLIPYIVALSLTAPLPTLAKDFAASVDAEGRMVVLTDRACRHDKTMPEAYHVDLNGDRSHVCYWFGIKNVHFESPSEELRSIPKKQFHLVKNII